MSMEIILPLVIALSGLLVVFCSFKDYEWFLGHRRAQLLVRIIGRTATRGLYAFLGLVIFVTGLFVLVKGP